MTLKELEEMRNKELKLESDSVKEDPWALRYVKDQTPEICLEAVKQDKHAIIYVKDLSILADEK